MHAFTCLLWSSFSLPPPWILLLKDFKMPRCWFIGMGWECWQRVQRKMPYSWSPVLDGNWSTDVGNWHSEQKCHPMAPLTWCGCACIQWQWRSHEVGSPMRDMCHSVSSVVASEIPCKGSIEMVWCVHSIAGKTSGWGFTEAGHWKCLKNESGLHLLICWKRNEPGERSNPPKACYGFVDALRTLIVFARLQIATRVGNFEVFGMGPPNSLYNL